MSNTRSNAEKAKKSAAENTQGINRMAIENTDLTTDKPPTKVEMLILAELAEIKKNYKKINTIEETMTNLSKEITARFEEYKTSLNFFYDKIDDFEKKVAQTEKKVKELSTMDIKHKVLEQKIHELQEQLDEKERQNMQTSAEIRGIPEIQDEKLNDIIFNINNAIKLNKNDIEDAYRAPGKRNHSATRSIIIKFKNQNGREEFLNEAKKFNKNAENSADRLNTSKIGFSGPKMPIYINEHLTTHAKRMLFLSKQIAKKNHFAYVWVKAGRVYIRQQADSRAIFIRTENTILEIEESIAKNKGSDTRETSNDAAHEAEA